MARNAKLNDLQLILLSTAAHRPDGNLLPPPEHLADQAARIRKVIPPLLTRALVIEVEVSDHNHSWRQDGKQHFGLLITDAARAVVMKSEPGEDDAPSSTDVAASDVPISEIPASSSIRPTKIASVVALLQHESGATLAVLVEKTGWLPHTTRAALTGLRKKGHAIEKGSRDGVTSYSIKAA